MEQMNKEEIDQLIEKSLSREEAHFYNELDQQGVFKMWFGLYTGKLGWWAVLVTIFQLIFTALAFYWGYKFFTVEGMELMLHYGGAMFIAILFTQMLKLWHWMQMDKNSILREMKRLEFQVAVLMEKARNDKGSTEIG
ncbi:MAG: DUF6768 family protein [Balneolaceae bacterium]|nr:DUF6768 family protein [Balneolaceae bacterium]